jgi:glucokinase
MILVGDIGGTNTRLALAARSDDGFRMEHEKHFATPSNMPALVRSYLDGVSARPAAAALCGAGPLRDDGSILLTNVDCLLEPDAIGAAAGVGRALIVNDFEAIAHAIPALRSADLRACGGGIAHPRAPCVVLGAGTGLGIATLMPHGGDWLVIPGEGGHVDLAPVDDEELAVWQKLRQGGTRISAETVLSGAGLRRLYCMLPGSSPDTCIDGPSIARAARTGDIAARAAQRLFARWLGRVAGNAALTLGARGGVYIAGGIIPAWGDDFDIKQFRTGFEDKAPFRDWLAAIPCFVVTCPQPALFGLARLAAG